MAESESRIALIASIISEEQLPKRQTPNAKRQTPNAKRQTPNAKRQTPNPKPQTPNPKPQTPNPKPQTPNPEIARLSQTVCNDRSEPFSVLLHWSLLV